MDSNSIWLRRTLMSGISRRTVLQGLGAAGLAAGLSLPLAGRASAADPVTLRWWSPQASPDQLEDVPDPDRHIRGGASGREGRLRADLGRGLSGPARGGLRLQAGAQHRHAPALLRRAELLRGKGLVEPMDDVIKAIGEDKYFPGANDVYKTADGHYCGTASATPPPTCCGCART